MRGCGCLNTNRWKIALCGAIAGMVNGLFGAGGGMVLIPLMHKLTKVKEDQIFPASVSIIFPICFVSMLVSAPSAGLPFSQALPYLIGAIPGGLAAAFLDGKISTKWLHRIFGALILWGGVRYLWQ